MIQGIIMIDGEKVGIYSGKFQADNTLLIAFDSVRDRDRLLDLASEHGASLSFLEMPPVPPTDAD